VRLGYDCNEIVFGNIIWNNPKDGNYISPYFMHADRALIRVSGKDLTRKIIIFIRNMISNILKNFLSKLRLIQKNKNNNNNNNKNNVKNKNKNKNSRDDFSFRIFLLEFENLNGYVENIDKVSIMNFQGALGQVVTPRTYAASANTSPNKRKNDFNFDNEYDNDNDRDSEKLRNEYFNSNNNINNNSNNNNDDLNRVENKEENQDYFSSFTTWDPLNFFGENSIFSFPNFIPMSDVLTSARTAVRNKKEENERKIRDIEIRKQQLIDDKKIRNKIKKFLLYCLNILLCKADLFYSYIMNMLSIIIINFFRNKKEIKKDKNKNKDKEEIKFNRSENNEMNNLNGNCSKTVDNCQKHWGIHQLFLLDKIMVHDIKVEILNICDKTEIIYLKNFLMLGTDFEKNDEIENMRIKENNNISNNNDNNNTTIDQEQNDNDFAKHIEIELVKEAEQTSSFTAYCNSLKRTTVSTTAKNVHVEIKKSEFASNSVQFAADEKSGYPSDLAQNSPDKNKDKNKDKDMKINNNDTNNKIKNNLINSIINHDNEVIPKSNNNSIYEINYGEIGHHLDTIIFRIWALIKTNLITQNRSKIMKIGAAVAFTRTKSAFLSPFTNGFKPSSKGKIAWNKRSTKSVSPSRPIIIDRTETDYSFLNKNIESDSSSTVTIENNTTENTNTGTNSTNITTTNSTYSIGGVYGIGGSSSKMNVLYEATMGFLSSSRCVTPTIFLGPANGPTNSPGNGSGPGVGVGVGPGTDPILDPVFDPIIDPYIDPVLPSINPLLDPNPNNDPPSQILQPHPILASKNDPIPISIYTTREMRGQSSISICTISTDESFSLCGVGVGHNKETEKEVEKEVVMKGEKEVEKVVKREVERCRSADDYSPKSASPNLSTITVTDSAIYGSRSFDPQSSQSPRFYPRAPSMEMPAKLRPPSIRTSAIRLSVSSERTTPVSARTPPTIHSTFLGPLPYIPNPSGISPKNSFPVSQRSSFSLSPRRSGSPWHNGKSVTPNGFSPKSPASGIFNATFKNSTVTLTAAVNNAAGGISGKYLYFTE
jgi:hypothetical protein